MRSPPTSSCLGPPSLRHQARRAAEAGFTLIELLICLVIGALMVSALFRSINAQGRVADLQSAREEVQQNSRASLELIASELRSISTPGAIVRAARDSITFRTTRLWGVVCASSAETLDLVVSEIDRRYFSVTSGSGVVVNLGTSTAPEWSEAGEIVAATSLSGGCGEASGGEAARLSLQLASAPRRGGELPAPGDLAGIFDQLTYRSGSSSGLRGRWIQRRSGDGPGSTNQPLAGPIRGAGEGLRFRYYGPDGSALPATLGPAASRDSVRSVELLIETVSIDESGGVRAARRDSVTIPLRNLR